MATSWCVDLGLPGPDFYILTVVKFQLALLPASETRYFAGIVLS